MNRDLWTLARQGIWRRRRSSLLLFLVLLLSFAFAVMMLSVMGSMDRTNTELLKNTYGGWYGAIPDGKAEDRAFLERREWLDQFAALFQDLREKKGKGGYSLLLQSPSHLNGLGISKKREFLHWLLAAVSKALFSMPWVRKSLYSTIRKGCWIWTGLSPSVKDMR